MLSTVVLFALIAQPNAGETFTATVVEVVDGDTVKVRSGERDPISIRFGEIDAPERNQGGGQKSKAFLAKLVQGKEVRVVLTGKQSYDRQIGSIHLGDIDASLEMVRQGHAWWFWQFAHESSDERSEALAETMHVLRRSLAGSSKTTMAVHST